MILFGVDGMAAAKNSTGSKEYCEGWDRLFKKDEQKPESIQKSNQEEKNSEGEKEEIKNP